MGLKTFEGEPGFVNPLAQSGAASPRLTAPQQLAGGEASDGDAGGRARSLYLLDVEHPVRSVLLKLVGRQEFDWLILTAIGCNSAMMAMEDPLEDRENLSDAGKTMAVLDLAFTIFFTCEMLLKVVAMGFVVGKHTYLRDAWNQLDAVVVATSWLPYLLHAAGAGTRIFRTFRLLRPMRSISRFPGLKRLVVTILMAIPQLQLVLITVGLFFVTFGTIGVQLWPGTLLQRCHSYNHTAVALECDADDFKLCAARRDHMFAGDHSEFCDLAATPGEDHWWEGSSCPEHSACELHNTNPYFDILSHDRIDHSFVVVLMLVTVTSWQEIMHLQQDTSGEIVSVYFVACTLLGGYFLLNLFVAVLKSKFEISKTVHQEGSTVFEVIDEDNSGELDKGEINTIFLDRGVTLNEEEIDQVFNKMDKNNDGGINMNEFLAWLRSSDILSMQLRTRMNMGSDAQVRP